MKEQIDPSGREATDQNETGQSLTTQRVCLKIAETAKAMGVNPVTVRRMIARGLLKPYRGLRTPLIPVTQLKNLIENSIEPAHENRLEKVKSKTSKNGSGKRSLKNAPKKESSYGKEVR
jgi:hypothetical protein